MTIIGITGGTGAGKTTLLEELKSRGALVIDCDKVYHELLQTSEDMKRELGARFEGIVQNGILDRKALGKIVFSDPEALTELNTITHKYVGLEVNRRIEEWEKNGGTLVGIDAIALIVSGIHERCNIVIGVTAPTEIRARRIMEREGISRDYALLRIASQQPDSFFDENCDVILENKCETLAEFKGCCKILLDDILGGLASGYKR